MGGEAYARNDTFSSVVGCMHACMHLSECGSYLRGVAGVRDLGLVPELGLEEAVPEPPQLPLALQALVHLQPLFLFGLLVFRCGVYELGRPSADAAHGHMDTRRPPGRHAYLPG